MIRARRWLFRGTTAISMVFFISSTALWIRSYSAADFLGWHDPPSSSDPHPGDWYYLWAFNSTGGIWIQSDYSRNPGNNRFFPPRELEYSRYQAGAYAWCDNASLHNRFLGFQFVHQRYTATDLKPQISSTALTLPWAAPCAIFLIVPVLAARSWRRDRRQRQIASKVCLQCGYDLRASPERCPECGTAVPAVAKTPRIV